MKNPSIAFLLFLIVSCTKQIDITPQLEKELSKTLYNNESVKKDSYSFETAIDSSIQNSTNQALIESLKEHESDNGFVIVMETNTGKIKALVGLEKNTHSNYVLSKNIAINTPIEPGSLIKTFDMMSLLEDKKSDTSSVYDAKGGKINYFGQNIIDSHLGFNKISLSKAFQYSSNTVFAKAIDSAYRKKPNQYIENFNKFGLGFPYSQISSKSNIPSPNSKSWSKITLPWLGFGYGLQVTPIQLLTFYNSIANNGVMIEPLFLNNIKKDGELLKEYLKPIVVKTYCSQKSNLLIKSLLRDAVKKGICKNVDSDKISISGYSATTQINYSEGDGTSKYAFSFVGYFPSNKPKYTVLVYVNNPNISKGYNGSVNAGKVVKRIAEIIN